MLYNLEVFCNLGEVYCQNSYNKSKLVISGLNSDVRLLNLYHFILPALNVYRMCYNFYNEMTRVED